MAVDVTNLNTQLARLQAGEARMEAKIDELVAASGSGAADTAAAQSAVDGAASAVSAVADKMDAKVAP
jgi:hypothetical protein